MQGMSDKDPESPSGYEPLHLPQRFAADIAVGIEDEGKPAVVLRQPYYEAMKEKRRSQKIGEGRKSDYVVSSKIGCFVLGDIEQLKGDFFDSVRDIAAGQAGIA
jgi:hypothetical protein